MRVWSEPGSPEEVFFRWGARYLHTFDLTHAPSAAERAAAVLQQRFRMPPSLDELATMSGVSRSGLNRDFQKRYGISQREYLTRVRLRIFIEAIRCTDVSACQAAEDAGYGSYHNLLEALRSRTSLTPVQLRGLTYDQTCAIVDERLSVHARS
jgi:methylphosphotriester-DNA--protein-cysteine methyltransferase